MDLFRMIWGLIWYHSRGHTTKIDFGKRSRLKKKQKLPRDQPFEIIGFTCWPRMQKFILKLKSSLKNVFFRRCGQNDGGFLAYRSSEHDTLFKTLLRDVFSSKLTHSIISLKFMKKKFENLTFFTFSVIFTYDFMLIFLL